jgi:hypothetical protein
MSRGADVDNDLYVDDDELVLGANVQWFDVWNHDCHECRGSGVFRNRPCMPCGASGRVQVELRKSVVIKIPAGMRIGQKIRLKGLGFPGSDDAVENRGDLILTLRPYGDGKIQTELPPGPRSSPRFGSSSERRSLPGRRDGRHGT